VGSIKLIKGFEKIAAGEVIERPASVVKELVENALDAGATHITINLEKAGKALIQIIDDGCGIPNEELEIAFLRHTSSKIDSAEDLDQLHTLGFRGEALASIAAVSQIEIISRPANQATGARLILNGGKKETLEECGAPIGTNLQIRNLFFNLPVRQKFLRSDRIELGHISDVVSRYTLAYPMVHFKLIHNSLVLLNAPEWIPPNNSTEDLVVSQKSKKPPLPAYLNAIQNIYGKNVTDQLLPIEYSDEQLQLFGYLGHPTIARSEKSAASLFVNQRLVIHQGIADIVENSYRDYLMRQKYPFYILFIQINPNQVDFNIHPSKKIVKFLDEDRFLQHLQQQLQYIVNKSFNESRILPQNSQPTEHPSIAVPIDTWTARPSQTIEYGGPTSKPTIRTESEKTPVGDFGRPHKERPDSKSLKMDTDAQIRQPAKKVQTTLYTSDSAIIPTSGVDQSKEFPNEDNIVQSDTIPTRQLPAIRFLNAAGQAGETYLVFQNNEGLIIFDQHAVDERINYERVQELLKKDRVPVQKLLIPIKMDVATHEVDFVQEAATELLPYGFEVEHFGGTSFLIRSIPAFIKNANQPLLIADMCREILMMGRNKSLAELKREIVQYMACHKSIRAGDPIWNRERVRRLIAELDDMQNPHHCAHGRPTYISITFAELEKLFHRKV
jgi:DNA mismatch repair protein MutL